MVRYAGLASMHNILNPRIAFTALDALSIAELHKLKYAIPQLQYDKFEEFANGTCRPTRLIISSPNMPWVPDVAKDQLLIRVRLDGRFYTADFTLVPQLYFEGTYYMPYVLTKPPAEELASHEYRLLWYDIDLKKDFVLEPGSSSLGRLRKDLVHDIRELRRSLSAKIKAFIHESPYNARQSQEMSYSEQGMLFAAVALDCAPQTFALTLLTFTSFQWHFLEALACYHYFTKWILHPVTEKPRDVDMSIMGTITPDPEVAIRFFMRGVPVWLLRSPSQLLQNTQIFEQCTPSLPPNLVTELLPDGGPIYREGPSAFRNRACQGFRARNIRLSHTAYTIRPGELGNYLHFVWSNISSRCISIHSKIRVIRKTPYHHLKPAL